MFNTESSLIVQLLLTLSTATFRTVLNTRPIFLPLFAPGEGT